ncbi:MAG TPA: Holliday junction resolvase RuvX [Dongiaceae bacterium]|nr:Holliday junction resolvase RuvX [Dongiaceae bacterium]
MIFDDIATLCSSLNRHERLFGLDLGEKTIGIAVSDPGLHVATPVVTIRRKKFTLDAQELLRLIEERQVGGLVIGLPRNMDGSEGPRCQSVRQFASNLLKLKDLPIAFWDERLSTVAVTRDMIEADLSRAKRAQAVDRAAATFILQGALDFWQRQKAAT